MNSESLPTPPLAQRPRGFGPLALILACLIGAGAATATAVLLRRSESAAAPKSDDAATLYQCPMHPSIVQDHPGDCPICGMRLVKIERGAEGDGQPLQRTGERRVLFYRSPMDPKRTSPAPSKDEMGMDYLPVYAGEESSSSVPGLATVEIDPSRQQLIGLETVSVTRGPVGGAWRTVGSVAVDETRVRHINVKVPGFIERIYVDFVGKKVSKGDPLLSMYSPELRAAQEEYLLALETQGALATAGGVVAKDGDVLVSAARRKLALWDVPQSEIDRISTTREPTKTLTFRSPVAGVVTKKDVVEGMKLDAGAMPYEIVDLSSVWVLADVYESELRFVKEGMAAKLELNAFPNRDFTGKVVFIDPLLDAQTRTVKVRLTFPNSTGELRPQMFGEVVLLGEAHDGLRIPPDAVIDSGTQKVVFVVLGDGKFQPRAVELGKSDGVQVEVLSGLSAEDRVVTRANFLIDSESRLRASLAEMSATPAPAPEAARVLPGVSAGQPLPAVASPAGTTPRSRGLTDSAPTTPRSQPPSEATHAGHQP
jgi:Cu(I)/Ag(I) efflux system membrane fusion protein